MRCTFGRFARPAIVGLLSLALFTSVVSLDPAPDGARAQETPVLAIDADATGNTATVLGQRDVCIEVRSGDKFDVDLTAENIAGLNAYEVYMSLDTAVVHVIDNDIQLLLASIADNNAFDVSESVPENDGDNGLYRVGGANITEEPIVEGSGVLARLTLQAAGPGVTTLSVTPTQTDAGVVGPVLTDANAEHIGDTDGDSFFDGAVLDADVAVDQDCPADAEGPIAAIASGDGGGTPAWIFAVAAIGVVAAAGFGSMALIRMRRMGSRGSS